MNIHKNARLTLVRRLEMGNEVTEHKLSLAATAAGHGISVRACASGWVATWRRGERGRKNFCV